MKRLHFPFFVCAVFLSVLCGCDKTKSDCGVQQRDSQDAYGSYFTHPVDIYWGVSGGVRSYTYNYEFANICTEQNPKVYFTLGLAKPNAGSGNPISVSAGVYTCLGVQAQHATMIPNEEQSIYNSEPSEIGMHQCYSDKPSATIYPYMTVSFNTLGSSHDDSLYLLDNVMIMMVVVDYHLAN